MFLSKNFQFNVILLSMLILSGCGGGSTNSDYTTATNSGSTTATNSGSTTTTNSGSTTATTVARPTYNTGAGFYVVGSKIYDPTGAEFRIRGVNRVHWDQSASGLPTTGVNTERIALDFTKAPASNLGIITKQMTANKIVGIPGNWSATCKSDAASLSAIVDTWVAQASTWTQLNNTGIINIANEWGAANYTQQQVAPWAKIPNYGWRDGYIDAVQRMRAAGYTGLLMIDAGSCGQDATTIVRDGPAVLAADPQHNLLFDVHVYGGFAYPAATASWQQDYNTALQSLLSSGLPIIIGEFGPGKSIGPSPTTLSPTTLIQQAETNGWGWLAWAWDDNDLGGCSSDDNWFSMTTHCSVYTGKSSDLTAFGQLIVPLFNSLGTKLANGI